MPKSIFEHSSNCTPLQPRTSCEIVAWLRSKLVPADFNRYIEMLKNEPMSQSTGTSIDELGLSVRAHNGLRNDNLLTIEKVVQNTESDLLRIPNFGRRSLAELKEALASKGFSLKERKRA